MRSYLWAFFATSAFLASLLSAESLKGDQQRQGALLALTGSVVAPSLSAGAQEAGALPSREIVVFCAVDSRKL